MQQWRKSKLLRGLLGGAFILTQSVQESFLEEVISALNAGMDRTELDLERICGWTKEA